MLRKFEGRYKLYSQGETTIMATITNIDENPHIVRYYHAWVENKKFYLAVTLQYICEYLVLILDGILPFFSFKGKGTKKTSE